MSKLEAKQSRLFPGEEVGARGTGGTRGGRSHRPAATDGTWPEWELAWPLWGVQVQSAHKFGFCDTFFHESENCGILCSC